MTASPPRAPRPGSEAGATLIELLMAVVIMSIAFVIIIGGIAAAILGSDLQKQEAGADVALRTAAEKISYTACAPTYAADPVDGFTLTVTNVSYWNPGTNAFEPTCPADTGLQLVELTATSTSGRAPSPEKLQVVKRRP